MSRLFVAALACGLIATAVSAQECIDVEQRNEPVYMKAFAQQDCAQSFIPQNDSLEGAGLKTRPGIGVSGAVTIQLWEGGLPNGGGTMIATGTDQQVTNGEWADVQFDGGCVDVRQGATYYLVFLNDNNSLGIQGDTGNPYPDGNVYANPGYNAFPNFDYTFYTACCSGGATCNYRLKKSKAKRCDVCPAVGDEVGSEQSCEDVKDCEKKLKTVIPCPDGGRGKCKLKGKRSSCG